MKKVTVHHYLVWDHQQGRNFVPPSKATLSRIELDRGTIVPGTAEQVDAGALDGRGRYAPSAEAGAEAGGAA